MIKHTDKSPVTETHICCSAFSFDLWLCRKPKKKQISAFELRLFRWGISFSLMEIATLYTSFAIMLHNWKCLHIQRAIEEMVTVQGGAGYPHHWHRTWHWRCWCLLFGTLGLWWADWGPLQRNDCSRFNSSILIKPSYTPKSLSSQQEFRQVVTWTLTRDYVSILCARAERRPAHKKLRLASTVNLLISDLLRYRILLCFVSSRTSANTCAHVCAHGGEWGCFCSIVITDKWLLCV